MRFLTVIDPTSFSVNSLSSFVFWPGGLFHLSVCLSVIVSYNKLSPPSFSYVQTSSLLSLSRISLFSLVPPWPEHRRPPCVAAGDAAAPPRLHQPLALVPAQLSPAFPPLSARLSPFFFLCDWPPLLPRPSISPLSFRSLVAPSLCAPLVRVNSTHASPSYYLLTSPSLLHSSFSPCSSLLLPALHHLPLRNSAPRRVSSYIPAPPSPLSYAFFHAPSIPYTLPRMRIRWKSWCREERV